MRDGFPQRARHVVQTLRQILLLNREGHLENSAKNLLMAEPESLLNGIGRINGRQAGMLIAPRREIAQRRDVD